MTKDVAQLAERVGLLEKQVARLSALLGAAPAAEKSDKSFRDFRGCLKGKLNATDELIEECKIKLEWDKILPE